MNPKTVLALSAALQVVIFTAHSRPVDLPPDLSKVDFVSECTTLSDPSNRLLYAHEEVVNSFLDADHKFGSDRMPVMHLGNEHLATHGGTTTTPGQWTENGQLYKMQNDWGMIGDVAEASPKVYFLKVTGLMRSLRSATPAPQGEGEKEIEGPKPSERKADPFEVYAISLLKKGEPIVRWERDGFMRAVGAIRSSTSCQRCHGAKDGTLLGAFTYEFGKTAAPPPTAEQEEVLQYNRDGKSEGQMSVLLDDKAQKLKGCSSATGYWKSMARTWLLDVGIVTSEAVKDQNIRRGQLVRDLRFPQPIRSPR